MMKQFCLLTMALFLWAGFQPAVSRAVPLRFEVTGKYLHLRERTRWYGLYHADKKIGFLKEEFFARGKEDDRIWVYRFSIDMKVQAAGRKADVKIMQEMIFDGQRPYGLQIGKYSESSGQSVRSIEITRGGERDKAVISQGGEILVRKLHALHYTLSDVFAGEIWIQSRPNPGDKIRWRELDWEKLVMNEAVAELDNIKATTVEGIKTDIYEGRLTWQGNGLSGIFRADARGKPLSFMVGSNVEARLEPEHLAKDIHCSRDLFLFYMVHLDRPLGLPPPKVTDLVLRVSGKGASSIPNGPRQSIRKEGDSFLLFLGADHGYPARATEKEIRENLKQTLRYPIKHKKIANLAHKALGNANEETGLKVMRLVGFVHKFIKDELVFGDLPIFEIIRRKRGDCSEHAHLFAALARASGIPAREVFGLTYLNDKLHTFGWHAWNEVVLNGRWVPVDPTWLEWDIDATHISFGPEENTTWLKAIGKLSFNLVAVNKRKGTFKRPPPSNYSGHTTEK